MSTKNLNERVMPQTLSVLGWHRRFHLKLKTIFYHLGYRIGDKPAYFIITSILLALLFGTGLQRLSYHNDPSYIFVPAHGQAQRDQDLIEQLFPLNYSGHFDPSRFTKPGRFARLIITAQDHGSLLRSKIWDEIQALDQIIKNVTILMDGDDGDESPLRFDTLCAKWGDNCYGNDILSLAHQMDEIEAGNLTLHYPIMDNYAFPLVFGGMELSNQSTVLVAKALQLAYFLDVNTPTRDQRGRKWEKAVASTLTRLDPTWKLIKVDRFMERTLADEIDYNTFSLIPYSIPAGTLMVIFGVVSCLMTDCVRSKPYMGIAAVITSSLGTLAAFGLLCYLGVPFIGLNVAAPFLMMGIGMDDAFVLLAAWRQTSVHDPVAKRLAESYQACGVSVTLTSLTDMISFFIGMASPFVSIQIFSAYTATAVMATYIFHTFFFGAALAYSGYQEAGNRHSIFWWMEATPRSKMETQSCSLKHGRFYTQFFTGGIDPSDPHNPVDHPEHVVMTFFRDRWAPLLMRRGVKIVVGLIFAVYLSISCYGISQMREGMELKRLAGEGRYPHSFFEADQKYFKNFPYRLQIVLSNPNSNNNFLQYSDPRVQNKIERLMTHLENTKFTQKGGELGESWLRSFLALAENSKLNGLFDLDIGAEIDFIKNLKNYYLGPNSVYDLDVKFDGNGTKILASRFIIQATNVRSSSEEWEMVQKMREIASTAQIAANLKVTVFHPIFLFTDQYAVIQGSTIQLVSVAAVVMMVVSVLLIPNPLCSIWVAFSVISIEAGVLGFLVLWDVSLDVLSLIYLVMSIGFSVDFSAHIAYAYMSAEDAHTPKERLKSCLHSVGLPIVQGAASTILGVAVLVVAPSYDYIVFFKAILLVMFIAAAHGLILLPVLLTTFGPGSHTIDGRSREESPKFGSDNNAVVMDTMTNGVSVTGDSVQSNCVP